MIRDWWEELNEGERVKIDFGPILFTQSNSCGGSFLSAMIFEIKQIKLID